MLILTQTYLGLKTCIVKLGLFDGVLLKKKIFRWWRLIRVTVYTFYRRKEDQGPSTFHLYLMAKDFLYNCHSILNSICGPGFMICEIQRRYILNFARSQNKHLILHPRFQTKHVAIQMGRRIVWEGKFFSGSRVIPIWDSATSNFLIFKFQELKSLKVLW